MDKDYENFVARMGSFDMTLDDNTHKDAESISHHGTLGMKWGRHKVNIQSAKNGVDNANNIVRESRNINNTVSKIKKNEKRIDLSNMTDKELKDAVNRMNMEKQYQSLSKVETSKGHDYLDNTLSIAGSALAVTSSALGIALAIKQLKG